MKDFDPREHFPHPSMRRNQQRIFKDSAPVVIEGRNFICEAPTGTGKTDVGIAYIKYHLAAGTEGHLLYVARTKEQVDNVARRMVEAEIPGKLIVRMYGRSEYHCPWTEQVYGKKMTADEAPCRSSGCPGVPETVPAEAVEKRRDEPLAVGGKWAYYPSENMRNGREPGLDPYYQAKVHSMNARVVVMTQAKYVLERLFVRDYKPAFTVLDEAHAIAETTRRILSAEVRESTLAKVVESLKDVDPEAAGHLLKLLEEFRRVAGAKKDNQLLSEPEVVALLKPLREVDTERLRERVRAGHRAGKLDIDELAALEKVPHRVRSLVTDLEYAVAEHVMHGNLKETRRRPYRYVFSYQVVHEKKVDGKTEKSVDRVIVIKPYTVGYLLQKRVFSRAPVLAYSGTIGDYDIFRRETGLEGVFRAYESDFPRENSRFLAASDGPDFSFGAGGLGEAVECVRALVKVATAAGRRALVLTVSFEEEAEVRKVLAKESVEFVAAREGEHSRAAAKRFQEGEGSILLGTMASFGEGLDLPDGMAPLIIVLRSPFPPPTDPQWTFEQRMLGDWAFRLMYYRAGVAIQQARGRNIRSRTDRGVCVVLDRRFAKDLRQYYFTPWVKEMIQVKKWRTIIKEVRMFLNEK